MLESAQQSSSFVDEESTDVKSLSRSSSQPPTPRSDRKFLIQPKNIRLNEMFILQSLKNQMKRKNLLGMLGRSKSG